MFITNEQGLIELRFKEPFLAVESILGKQMTVEIFHLVSNKKKKKTAPFL